MTSQGSTPELAKASEDIALGQLNRILSSKAFRQADRLKRFLTFTVNETLAGRGEQSLLRLVASRSTKATRT